MMKTITRLACVAAILYVAGALNLAPGSDGRLEASSAQSKVAAQSLAAGDFTIGPKYTNAPELTVKNGVPKGTLHEFTMTSQESKIYPGLKGAYKRKWRSMFQANMSQAHPRPSSLFRTACPTRVYFPKSWTI